ncbi:MAG TPA: hypothetical protein VK723_04820, partial [Thermoplasmata archaeon]|nr:hypothetical protein [Thermoplasmata archaeon]
MFARRNPHTAGRRRDTGLFRTTRDLVASLVGIVVLLVALDRLGAVSIPFMLQWWPFLVTPATTALGATTIAFAVGFVIAIPLGLVRAYGPNAVRRKGAASVLIAPAYGFTTGYVEAVRGTPAFVQI